MLKITVADALGRLVSASADYTKLIGQNAFDVGIYRPEKVDPQTPHARDELYVIATGSGEFLCGDDTKAFGPGDLFYVRAGVEHRFLNFSEDFATWVIFFAPGPNSIGSPV